MTEETDVDTEDLRGMIETEFSIQGPYFTDQGIAYYIERPDDLESRFKRLRDHLKGRDLVPFLFEEGDRVVLRISEHREETTQGPTPTHWILFLATILTTMTAGALLFQVDILENPLRIWRGWPFSASILLVLGMHELGHYFISRRRGVPASLPYFIPVPPPFILGTLGALIRTEGPMPDRKAMFDIGVAGPLLGVAFSIPVTLIGFYLSPVELAVDESPLVLGVPVIYRALEGLVPIAGEGGLHPVAFAGWVGFFITFLNLLPVGQLDGGHISRALFGDMHHQISSLVPIFLLSMGFALSYILEVNGGIWIMWGFISLFFHSAGHPPPLNDVTDLDRGRRLIGVFVFVLMILCFTPVPFQFS